MARKEAKVLKMIERYEKVIEEHRRYYKEYRGNVSRENFKKFLSFQNKQVLSFQIMANQVKKDYENRFRQAFDQRLALDSELIALEKSSNRTSNAAFEDIKKTVNSIMEKTSFIFNPLSIPHIELFRIYQKMENIENGLQDFDRKFAEVKTFLQLKLQESRQSTQCDLIVIQADLLEVDLSLFQSHDALAILKNLIERIVDFQARLVILLDIAGSLLPHDRGKELL